MRYLSWAIILLTFLISACASVPNKNETQAHFLLGDSYLREGKYNLALKELILASQRSPSNPTIRMELGLAYMYRGDLKRAERELRKAISLKDDFGEAYNNLGLLYLKMNRWQDAQKCFLRAVSIPTYTTPEIAYTNLGSCYVLQKKYLKAERAFKQAIKLNFLYLPAYIGLGNLLEFQRRYLEALKLYQRAIIYLPKEAVLHYRVGMIYYRLGQQEAAKREFKRVIDLNPGRALSQAAQQMLEEMP